jgi:hypothetical protein
VIKAVFPQSRNDDASEAGHAARWRRPGEASIKCTVAVIFVICNLGF